MGPPFSRRLDFIFAYDFGYRALSDAYQAAYVLLALADRGCYDAGTIGTQRRPRSEGVDRTELRVMGTECDWFAGIVAGSVPPERLRSVPAFRPNRGNRFDSEGRVCVGFAELPESETIPERTAGTALEKPNGRH